ncbi:MAG: CRTAC1 family protein [Planctomycetes bacterium]|nr:CRTAC1 family protein [Planctomycetota bacterium]
MSARGLLLALVVLLAACGEAQAPAPAGAAPAPWFVESAVERGLDFRHQNGHAEDYWMPEILGGGGALFDLEQDGDLDAYLVQSGSLQEGTPPEALANRLYANDGTGHFHDATRGSGAEDPRYGMGVACADADGDADTDLFVTNLGRNTWLRNEGAGRFTDASESAGFLAEGWSTSAAFFDYDKDGALDLFVVRYVEWSKGSELPCMDSVGRRDYCSPKSYRAPARSLLYHNEGAGRFADVSAASAVFAEPSTGLGVATGDFDADGWLDVFVANDGHPNHQWRNLQDGRFENVAIKSGSGVDAQGVPKAGMGVLAADLDGDLDLDVLVCNLHGESDSYYRNEGAFFADRTPLLALGSLSKPFTRFGLALGDFDHDRRFDLYECNGRVERPDEFQPDSPYSEPNLLLTSLASGRMAEVLPRGGTAAPLLAVSRGVCQGDVDGDGDLDLLVLNNAGPAQLLLNQKGGGGNWILVRALEKSGGDALNAILEFELGEQRVRRDVNASFGYLSSHDPRVHLGLGALTRVDGVGITWVDGTRERFGPLEANHVHVLRRGSGTAQ